MPTPTKAAAKKAAPKAPEPPKRNPARAFDKDVQKQVVALRDTDPVTKWAEVAETLGMTEGQALQAYDIAKCPAKEKIKNATGADIVKLRDSQNLSWGQIVARVEIPESRCRTLYDEASGGSSVGNRIGKGGRYPGGVKDENGVVKPKASKAAAKKAAPAKAGVSLKELLTADVAAWEKALAGKTVRFKRGEKETTFKVKSVSKYNAEKQILSLVDADTGSARTLKATDITGVSK